MVFTHVAAHWIEEVDRAWVEARHLLSADDLAVNIPLLDEQGVAPHVPHLERQQLLGRPKSLVSDNRHHRRGVELFAREKLGSDRFHLGRCEAHHRALSLGGRLLHRLDRIRGNPPPANRLLVHPL
jgi:hypothetical protein